MNFNIFKKLFSFSRSSFSSLASENKNKIEEKVQNGTEEVACKSPFIIPLKMDPNAFEEHASAFDEKIDVCKEQADPKKYFGLFAKHLKKFDNDGLGKKIALIDLSNVIVDKMIIDLNPKAEYVLIDNFLDYQLLKGLVPDVDLSLICTDDGSILKQFEELQKLNTNMKFDVVVGNPPYSRNLHLKISCKVLQFLNEDGIYVSLQPFFMNLNELSICTSIKRKLLKHMKDHELIPAKNSDSLFNIYSTCDLNVFTFSKKEANIFSFPEESLQMKIFNKLRSKKKAKSIRSSIWSSSGNFEVPIQGDYGYAKRWHYTLDQMLSGNPTSKMKFNSKEEAFNFKNITLNRKIYKFIYSVDDNCAIPAHLPFLGECLNTRTNTIGYESNWTDEDLYLYFELTDDEIKLIEDTIKE